MESNNEMLLHPRLLKAFVVMTEERHFSRAAQRLGISQSTLSEQIRSLEEILHVQVFTRHTREVLITPAGLRLLPLAEQRLAEAQQFVDDARRLAQRIDRLQLGCLPAHFTLAHPLVPRRATADVPEFDLVTLSLREAAERMRSGQLDAVICTVIDGHVPNGLSWIHVADDRAHVLMVKDHPLAERPAVTNAEILGFPIFVPDGYEEIFRTEIKERFPGSPPGTVSTTQSALHMTPRLRRDKALMVVNGIGVDWVKATHCVLRPLTPTWSMPLGIVFPQSADSAMRGALQQVAAELRRCLTSVA